MLVVGAAFKQKFLALYHCALIQQHYNYAVQYVLRCIQSYLERQAEC